MAIVFTLLSASLAMPCYLPPVSAPVTKPFVAAPCQYCPGGHRGFEYAISLGSAVRAVSGGVVTFVGMVVGTRYVVVLHPDGLSATYGDLLAAAVGDGDHVSAGSVIGTTTDDLYFGLRRDDTYLDPADYLAVIRHHPRLVPTSGARPRPAPPGVAVCPSAPGHD